MREKRGETDGKRGRRKTDWEGACLHLSEMSDMACVFSLVCLCVRNEMGDITGTERHKRGKGRQRVCVGG